MKKNQIIPAISGLLIFLFVISFQFSFAQAGTWTWISGSNVISDPGVFGTQGVSSVNNYPPSAYEYNEWKDKQGNFWLYGGMDPQYSDLWKYNPVTTEWTWVNGNGLVSNAPVYGIKGISNPSNNPGVRFYASITWVDTAGNLWLFGGADYRNDLWKYDIGINEWTWIGGSNTINATAVYGTKGIPSINNIPAGRQETCSGWTDSVNNLWLFGGRSTVNGGLNDLWRFNISTNEWTWMTGSTVINTTATYGTKGVSSATNDPGGRCSYTKWKNNPDNFWIYGGVPLNPFGPLDDMWRYVLSSNEWTWMHGNTALYDAGNYHVQCAFDSINLPPSRWEHRSAVTDNCGKFWLFGGTGGSDNDNDLWVFDPQQTKWNWLNGSNTSQTGNYGTRGVASTANSPPSRKGAVAWWGNDNKFYFYGGGQAAGSSCYADLWAFTPDTACVPSCNLLNIPVANFTSSDTVFCDESGKCISFTDHSTGNPTGWHWLFPGAIPDSSDLQNPDSICYYTPGTYPVALIVTNSTGTDTLTVSPMITLANPPASPTLTFSNDTIFSSHAAGYQWYYNGSPIAGATDSFYVYSSNGTYAVMISDGNGCSILSSGLITGLYPLSFGEGLGVSPNPATDEFTSYGLQFTGVATLEIYSVIGIRIYSSQLQTSNLKLQTINCKQFPAGVYFIRLTDEKGSFTKKFVKE